MKKVEVATATSSSHSHQSNNWRKPNIAHLLYSYRWLSDKPHIPDQLHLTT